MKGAAIWNDTICCACVICYSLPHFPLTNVTLVSCAAVVISASYLQQGLHNRAAQNVVVTPGQTIWLKSPRLNFECGVLTAGTGSTCLGKDGTSVSEQSCCSSFGARCEPRDRNRCVRFEYTPIRENTVGVQMVVGWYRWQSNSQLRVTVRTYVRKYCM